MKPNFSWLWSINDIAFMHFWRTVFGQGRVCSGTAKRQKSMKAMSDKAIYQENFGFRKTNMLSATALWIPRMKYKDWKQKKMYAVTLYIECELKFLNLFLCVPFSILSIEYHVNYYSKSPYFSPYFSVSWISYNICLFVPCIYEYVHVFPNIFIPYNLPKHCTQSHRT